MRRLHYRGRLGDYVVLGQRVGPNTLGEYLWVTGASYDPEKDVTTVDLSYRAPAGQGAGR